MNDYEFGNFIMTLRIGNGFSQFQLGKLMGVSDKAVSKWETGKSKPRLDTCRRLAEVFGISIEDFLEMNTKPKADAQTARKEALWEKARLKLYEYYGDKPPIIFLARLESEKAALRHTDVILHLDLVSKINKAANENQLLIIPRGWISNFLVSWLMGATYVNPLRPFSHCPKCHKTILHPEAKDGWDLPREKCSCGEWMINDGHNLPFEGFANTLNQSGRYDIDLNLSTKMFNNAEAIIREHYQNTYDVVRFIYEPFIDPETGTAEDNSDHFRSFMLVSPSIRFPRSDGKNPLVVHMDDYEKFKNITEIHIVRYISLDKRIDMTKFTPYSLLLSRTQTTDVQEKLWNSWRMPYSYHCDGTEGSPELVAEQWRKYKTIIQEIKNNQICFSDLCQIQGMVHGTGIWQNNGEELIKNGTAKLTDLAAFREDVWNYILGKMTPLNSSGIGFPLKVMDHVRLGRYAKNGMDEETRRILLELGVPAWYIDHICKINYQFPKGHTTAHIITSLMYRSEYPDLSISVR